MADKVIRTHTGSALLVLIGLLALIMIYIHTSLRLTSQIHDIALLRGKSMQHMYATEGLLLYGIAWCKKNIETVESTIKKRPIYEIYKGSWHWMPDKTWEGSLVLTYKKPTEYYLEASLYNKNKIIAKQVCTLMYDVHNNKYTIKLWKIV
jgi:hypothetical protein